MMKRCLFTHKWIRKASNLRSAVPYRTCERCGTMQRGIYDSFWKDISWETIRERAHSTLAQIQVAESPSFGWEPLRERAYVTPERIRFVRKPSSRLNRLAHSLGLRRSRVSDATRSGNGPR